MTIFTTLEELNKINDEKYSFDTIKGVQNSIDLFKSAKDNAFVGLGELVMKATTGLSIDDYIAILEKRLAELKNEDPEDNIDETYDEDEGIYPDGYEYVHKVSDEQYNLISKLADDFINLSETSKDIELSERQKDALKGTLMEFASFIALR